MSKTSQRLVYLTRIEKFSAAHRLYNSDLSVEENRDIFDKCNNCHGHNYTVEITVKGKFLGTLIKINPKTGMAINITELKRYIQAILDKLDHKNLDVDVEYFQNVISTSENLTVYLWEELEKRLVPGSSPNEYYCQLHEVKLFETDKNICIYRGE